MHTLGRAVENVAPGVAAFLVHPWFESVLAVLLIVIGLYVLGWATTQVLGRKLLEGMESLLDRIPLVKAIYGGTKKLVTAFQAKPEGVERVVLINFPSREMKTIGFVTRTLVDRESGIELAVVYVPTAPNPTSGYMEIVPVGDLTPTDWTMDEAMRFVITGGTSAPDAIPFGGRARELE